MNGWLVYSNEHASFLWFGKVYFCIFCHSGNSSPSSYCNSRFIVHCRRKEATPVRPGIIIKSRLTKVSMLNVLGADNVNC